MKRYALLPTLALALSLTACAADEAAQEAAPQETSADTTYTLAQVAEHDSSESCWTAIDGEVYDVTSWISQHPGGEERIEGLCGKDGTEAFTGQHEGEAAPTQRLASFQIGTLSD